MAKKQSRTAKASTATKSRKSSAAKLPAKPASKKSPPKRPGHDHNHSGGYDEEFELDEAEHNAVDHIVECDKAREALEREVNSVVAQAVRKICKEHGKPLTAAQALNVALVLFGD